MARLGWFDDAAVPQAWFDDSSTANGWFDETLLDVGSVAAATIAVAITFQDMTPAVSLNNAVPVAAASRPYRPLAGQYRVRR